MPVSNGGWCIMMIVGRVGSAASTRSSSRRTLLAHRAVVQTGQGDVEAHDPHGPANVGHIIDRAFPPAASSARQKRSPKSLALVVVARNRQHRAPRAPPAARASMAYSSAWPWSTRSPLSSTRSGRGSSALTCAIAARELRVRIHHALIELTLRAGRADRRDCAISISGRLAVEPLQTLAPFRRDSADTALHPFEPAIRTSCCRIWAALGASAGRAQRRHLHGPFAASSSAQRSASWR